MRILVFSGHTADFCSRAGGTIAKHVRKGDAVRVVFLAFGERSESGGLYADGSRLSLDEIRYIRREEATHAASILGAETLFLGWNDLHFDYSVELAKNLAEQVRSFRPNVVISHHGPDLVSVDHERTWRLVTTAVQMAAAPGLESDYPPMRRATQFHFEATVPLTELQGFNPDFYIDITDTWTVKLQALQAFHRGQPFLESWYTDVARHRASQARFITGNSEIKYAEAFERSWPWVGDHLPTNEL